MASYSYTRDLKDEDLAPPEVHVYTKKELWENWWDYNLKRVLVGIGVFALAVYFILDIFVFTAKIDYQIAIIAPETIPDSILNEMSDTLSPYLEDITGDGVVTLDVYSYYVDLSTYSTVTDVTGDVEELTEEEIAEQSDYSYFSTDTSTYDYYTEMAGQVQMATDLELGESVIFILADPSSFQIASNMLAYPDGTLPEDPETVAWELLVYEMADCSIFSDEVLEALDGFYIARRGAEEGEDFMETFNNNQTLWDVIIGDAQPYSEKLA